MHIKAIKVKNMSLYLTGYLFDQIMKIDRRTVRYEAEHYLLCAFIRTD